MAVLIFLTDRQTDKAGYRSSLPELKKWIVARLIRKRIGRGKKFGRRYRSRLLKVSHQVKMRSRSEGNAEISIQICVEYNL